MRNLILILFVSSSLSAVAGESMKMAPYTLMYDSLDTNLGEDEALFLFDLSRLSIFDRASELIYAIDNGENQSYDYSEGDTLEIAVTPGSHTLQFYAGGSYEETSKMQFEIEPQHRQLYRINFSLAIEHMQMKKPVIYLYPQETIDVSVDVIPTGEFAFTYPNIENGWNFTCDPDGTLRRGEETYRYLFWESEQEVPSHFINKNEGAIVSGSEAVAYLETQMEKFGMTSEERADFITYWGPILRTKTNLYIYLLFNEVCDAFASLEISPEPTQIGRFYVIWAAVPDDYNPSLESQEIPEMQRDGFTVLEWGGAEVSASQVLKEDL